MNAVEMVEQDIRHAVPAAWTRLRRPRNPQGEWWLDAKHDDHLVTIQWSPRRGFGVTASALGDGYGEGPEETFDSREEVVARVRELLRTKGNTVPPESVVLRELRGLVGVTQEELADKLGVQQAAVSRLERRDDITLSSLRRFVTALGGDLEISVRTSSGDRVRLAGGNGAKVHRAACVHVDERLSNDAPRVDSLDLSESECGAWLSDFEDAARSKWHFLPRLRLLQSHTTSIASGEWSTFSITLDHARISAMSCAIQSLGWKNAADSSTDFVRAVSRQLLAHEVGHFVDGQALRNERAFHGIVHRELQADAVAGWLCGRAGDDALLGSTIVAQLGCRVPDCSHPTPEERSHAYLVGHVRGAQESEGLPAMSLVVIRTSDVERSRAFYSSLGLELTPERHGSGPLHYSCMISDTIVELYPTKQKTGGGRLGLRIPGLTRAMGELRSSGQLLREPTKVCGQGGQEVFVIRDPDGNDVELSAL